MCRYSLEDCQSRLKKKGKKKEIEPIKKVEEVVSFDPVYPRSKVVLKADRCPFGLNIVNNKPLAQCMLQVRATTDILAYRQAGIHCP
jgi:hypothetical protein